MTPQELKRANIERFERLLGEEKDAEVRQAIERILADERVKPLSAYPAPTREQHPPEDSHP